jgi:DNA polymerase-1
LEVLEHLLPQLTPVTAATYQFSRDLQGPILEMNLRGLLVDDERRQEVITSYRHDIIRLTDQVNSLIRSGLGFQFEIGKTRKYGWPSDTQLKTIFHEVLSLPAKWKTNDNGERVIRMDREALEALEGYFYAEPIVRHILLLRELGKKVSFLGTSIDKDGRLRTSFNIAGTTTGRLASSFSDFGTGTNLQNIENRLRSIFVADPGYKFGNIDLEQSDSRAVGAIHWNLFRDPSYLDACESGDLHTTVARDGFPALQWTGNLIDDRITASGKFYREFSFRDAAKRLGHGTNYQGQADKMHRATHINQADIEAFQTSYLRKYPAFQLWWEWVRNQLRDTHRITTLLGRQRYFMGRWSDPETVRKAIAYEPQSITADTINRGMLAMWRRHNVQLLVQVHDSILFQYPQQLEDTIIPQSIKLIEQTIRLKDGRDFMIPAEAKVGWNWSDFDPKNPDPDAMRKYVDTKRPTTRTRRPNPSFLDRGVS